MDDNADQAIFQLFENAGRRDGPTDAMVGNTIISLSHVPTPHTHIVRLSLCYLDDHLTVPADARIPHGMTEHADLGLILRL